MVCLVDPRGSDPSTHDAVKEPTMAGQPDEGKETADEVGALVVRSARPEDREAILAFCDRIWGERDYVTQVWEDWLRDARQGGGVLLVGLLKGRPVGTLHLRMVSDDEAWVEGVRVDPDMRRQGIARALSVRSGEAAREHGASVVRVFVKAENAVAQALVAHSGFTRRAELARYTAPALDETLPAEGGARLVLAREEDCERIWAWLEQSQLRPFNGGVEIVAAAARALRPPGLRAHLRAGEVWLHAERAAIQALGMAACRGGATALDGSVESSLDVMYLDGSAEQIGQLALALRQVAAERGLATVEVWLPHLRIVREAMAGAGYICPEPDAVMYLYATG
jgi:ribosomal protein S18 acetylase RimI-like enzyme